MIPFPAPPIFGRRRAIALAAGLAVLTASIWTGPAPAQDAAAPAAPAIGGLRGGAYRQVIEEATERLRTERRRGDAADRGATLDALVVRSAALQASGFLPSAIADLRGARALADRLGDERQRAALTSRLGEAYLAANRIRQAAEALTEGLALARAAGYRDLEAATLNTLGNLYAKSTEVDALDYYDEAIGLATAVGDRGLAAGARLNAARLEIDRGRTAAAEVRIDRAFADLDRLPLGVHQARQYLWAGNLLHDLSWRAARPATAATLRRLAARSFERAAELSRTLRTPRILSNALGHLGQIAEDEGRLGDAVVLTRQALFQAGAADAPDRAYLWHARLARLYLRDGDMPRAIASYRDSLETLDGIRRDFPVIDPRTGKSTLREKLGPIYQGLADLYLRRAAAARDDRAAERDRRAARAVIERFKSAELEEYFQDDCAATLVGDTRPVDEVAEDAVVLYPILLTDRVELLVSHRGRIEQITVPRAPAALTDAVRRLRQGLASYEIAAEPAEGRVLYDWLVRPIEPVLARARAATLVFVPDGALRSVPLGVAHDGERFLAERLAVATAPGVTLVSSGTGPAPERGAPDVLLAGLTEGVQGFPPLPGVQGELAALAEIVGGTVLIDGTFTADTLRRQVRRDAYRIVHLASHGVFAGEGRNSFILTHDGRLDMDQLEALLKFGRPDGEPIDLLTLSACETAAGDDRAALGLAGIAVKAGVRSVLASLWQISDDATAALITEFYRNLADPAVSKAVALQRAQATLIESGEFSHPSFWSPFLLIGDWT